VMLGTRDPHKLAAWRMQHGENAKIGSFAEAAAFGELIVVATLGMRAVEAIAQGDPKSYEGKVVMDVTNPLSDDRPPRLAIGFDDSLGECVQRALPNARVVKAFNTVGAALMIDPKLPAGPPDMFIAGNDVPAKATVAEIARAFGWNVVDLGGIEASRYLEPMCMAWVLYGIHTGGWQHAFKMLTGD
jgi:predicted dinucleotide-binding enzyme